MTTKTVLWTSDLQTTIVTRSHSLRNIAHSLMGLAYEQHNVGDVAFQNLERLALALEQEAKLMEAVSRSLCQSCAMTSVVEEVRMAPAVAAGRRRRQPTKKAKGLR
jgi:hypothetical protein